MSLFNELKRRNVIKVTIAYIVMAWLVMQVADVILNNIVAPGWVFHVLLLFLAIGLPFVVFFAWAFEMTPEGLKRESEVDRSQSITTKTGRKLDFLIIGVLVLALGYFAYDKFVLSASRDDALVEATTQAVTEQAATESEASAESDKSIAVLPFVNMSDDASNEYFSDGISEELLNVLAQYPDLRVAARTSSFQFKGQNPDIEDIAQTLHVNYVLEGSVRKSGTRLRITAQLIEARTGFHLWSETFDRELVDVFAIQDEISAAIGDALEIQLALESATDKSSPTVLVATSMEAFEAYMHGRQLINLRGRANLEEAVTHLERALALDETYAPAHAQLAIATSLLSNTPGSYGDMPKAEVAARATPHIERAFELQPHLPEAFAAATLLDLTQADHDGVIMNARRVLELNPSYADAVNWLYIAYQAVGRYVDAEETLKRLLVIDPLSITGRFNLAAQLAMSGQMEVAREMANSIAGQSQAGSYIINARLSYYAGHPADSLGWALKAFELEPDDAFAGIFMVRTLSQLGLLPEALRLQDDKRYWAYLHSGVWPELVGVARQRQEADPSDTIGKLLLANALHLAGKIEQAQPFYEDLLASHPGLPVIDSYRETVVPTARAAFGRLSLGDEDGAQALLELTIKDQRERNRAGIFNSDFYRTAAILATMRGDHPAALKSIAQAIETGPRDPTIFSEPAFAVLRDSPEFHSLESRLAEILSRERETALKMICFNNPVADAWQPLSETCEGVVTAP